MSSVAQVLPEHGDLKMSAQIPHPPVTSLRDVSLYQAYKDGKYLHHSFCLLEPLDFKPWFGRLTKRDWKDTPTIDEINQHLQPVEVASVYPEKPESIRVVPASLENDAYIKEADVSRHFDNPHDPDCASREILHEASIMEMIPPHPNIVTYLGCRVRHGRITGIALERLEETLANSRSNILDVPNFLAELQSAVDHVHAQGLAHNDITPYNIMVKNGRPILIDFGGCAPPGDPVSSCGTPGWCEEFFLFSEMKHDEFAMKKLRECLEDDVAFPKQWSDMLEA